MVKKKARLYKMEKETGNWTQFKTYQLECKKEFKKAEINNINSTIETALEENNSKPFWRYVKSRRQDSAGTLRPDWLSANVTAAFKKGDSHLAENYRPVSLACVTCKLLEHIICKHIIDHLENNNILTSLNHGF